jgi:hypothetical protein
VASEIVTVCLDDVDGRDYVDALSAALARYDEDSDDPRWEAQWRISSDGDGFPFVAGQPLDDGRVLFADGVCVGGPRGRLDFDGAWAAAAAAAGRLWDAWHEFAERYPKARSLEDLYAASAADPAGYGLGLAEADYRRQPVVMAAPFMADGSAPGAQPLSLDRDPVGWFGLPRGDYMQRRAARLLPTAGLITREGEWLDPDRTPWRGASPAESNLNWFRIRLAYYAQADAYLRGLPPECFVVRVRVRT